MSFGAITSGSTVFVDANVLVYAFSNDPAFEAPCVELLGRIESREVVTATIWLFCT